MDQDLVGKKAIVIVRGTQTTTTPTLFKTSSTNTKSRFRENGSTIGGQVILIGRFVDTRTD